MMGSKVMGEKRESPRAFCGQEDNGSGLRKGEGQSVIYIMFTKITSPP